MRLSLGGRRRAVVLSAALLTAVGLSACGGDPTAHVACVDSTYSTEDVRQGYEPELVTIAERAAEDQGHLYVDACGANATGTVDWTVKKEFETSQDLSGLLLEKWADREAEKLEPEFREVLGKTSSHSGTPLGKILGVIARKCESDPGPCDAYVLTDASWWDNRLKVYDGVTPQEEREYLKTFGPLVQGLKGAKVYFLGVGQGTDLGEQRLHEAREVAEALVEAGGGEVVFWDVGFEAEEEEDTPS
jgi:hypothetical protein